MHDLTQNHGVLPQSPQPQEHMLGGETTIILSGKVDNWEEYLPKEEKQYASFDTMACTHFASGHIVETQIIYLWKNDQLSNEAKHFFKQFLKNSEDINSFRVSKQFSAIMGGNTPSGNYFTKAWDTWRKIGLVPDSMLNTLATAKSWAEYHDSSLITKEMLDIAAESLKYIEVAYQWLPTDGNAGFSASERAYFSSALKTAPINNGVPIPANHSAMQFSLEEKYGGAFWGYFNTYPPFISHVSENNPPVQFALHGVVTPKKKEEVKPFKYEFKTNLKFGMGATPEVHKLQEALQYLKDKDGKPYMKVGLFGIYGTNTKAAVGKFQTEHGLSDPDGQGTNFGPKTRLALNNLLNK